MMSASDGPSAVTAAVDIKMSTEGNNTTESDNSDMKQVWRCIYVDLAFVKSIYGILVAAEIILSLFGLISVSVPKNEGCAYLYSSSYAYYEFVASTTFITSLVWYGLYVLAITKKLSFVRWDIAEVIWCAITAFMYLIASSVVASNACYQGGYKAAAAFGFIVMLVLIGHCVHQGRSVLAKRASGQGQQSSAANTTDEEENKY